MSNEISNSALRLAVLAAIAVGGVLIVAQALAPRIAVNERAALLNDFESLTGVVLKDDDLPGAIGHGFDICRDGMALRVLITAVPGYGGPVELAIASDGTQIRGVRVLRHEETPGIGDIIAKHTGPWIAQFRGLPLARPADWSVDTVTGATITTRAVIAAVTDTVRNAHVRPCAS